MWILFAILFFLATCLWIGSFIGSLMLHSSDPAGNALARSVEELAVGALWVLLALLLAIAGWFGEMPLWCGIAALVLVPASGVSVQVAVQVMGRDRTLKWPAILPAAVPALMLAYSICCFASKLNSMLTATAVGPFVWGAVAVLTPLPWLAKSKQN
jgi:hypothetical protein